MQPEARFGQAESNTRPLAELLACPPSTGNLLNASSQFVECHEGDTVFRQGQPCRGLYIIVSGEFLRRADRLDTRVTLGAVHAGDLVELAAALGDGHHTYSLTAQSAGSLMLLSMESLQDAFRAHPPLRMRLLQELAREVSRGYSACRATRLAGLRRRSPGSGAPEN